MQNVQCMLQPCMMETNAVAWRGAIVVANRFLRARFFIDIYNREA